jgi:hypothetical protein
VVDGFVLRPERGPAVCTPGTLLLGAGGTAWCVKAAAISPPPARNVSRLKSVYLTRRSLRSRSWADSATLRKVVLDLAHLNHSPCTWDYRRLPVSGPPFGY